MPLSVDLAVMWLRDRARTLRSAADNCDGAAYSGSLKGTCRYVAHNYRRAAALLEDAAIAAEHDASMVTGEPREPA